MLDRFPGLAEGAYFLVAWIGLKLTISGLAAEKYHIPEWLFWSVMLLIMILSFVIKPKLSKQETMEASEDLDMLATEEQPEEESEENAGPAPDDKINPDPGRSGLDGLPSPSEPGNDRTGIPPGDHPITAEHSPDESR